MKKLTALLAILGLIGLQVAFAQTRSIKGTVTSKEDGMGLPGANVQVKGTTTGTATDFNGTFTLSVPADAKTLVFSSVGYTTTEMPVEDVVNVVLEPESKKIDEVVVIGYQVIKKKDLAGSVSSIKAGSIEKTPLPSFDKAIQGRASGIQVTANNGTPGGGVSVKIRGTGSIAAGTQPLYIIDGVTMFAGDPTSMSTSGNALSSINPSDIETFDILKDAAAASIYGAQAANGVVIITTKKGKEGKTKIDFSISQGVSSRMKEIKVMNSQQWIQLSTEAYEARYGEGYFESDYGYIATYGDPDGDGVARVEDIPTINWQDQVFRNGVVRDIQLSATGGNDKTKFFISGSHNLTQGQIIGTDFTRMTLRANLEHKYNKRVSFENALTLGRTKQHTVPDGGAYANPSRSAFLTVPFNPVYNPDGSYVTQLPAGSYTHNVVMETEYNKREAVLYNVIDNFAVNVDILDGLRFKSSYGLNFLGVEESDFSDPRTIDGSSSRGSVSEGFNKNIIMQTDQTLNYMKTFKEIHSISAVAGFHYEENEASGFSGTGTSVPNYKFQTLGATAIPQSVGGSYTISKLVGIFGRVNYTLLDRYYLTATLRRDGSSRFGQDNKFGLFPAASLAWRISKESFFPQTPVIDDIKLRASYGVTGQSNIGNFASLGLYGIGTEYDGNAGLSPSQLANPKLTWEEVHNYNAGVNFVLFKGVIDFTADFYLKKSKNLLQDQPLPITSGFSSITKNIGEVENKGLEIELNTTNLRLEGFEWRTNFNISFNENKVTKLVNNQDEIKGSGLKVGKPIGIYYITEWAGVNPADGRPMFYDKNHELTYRVLADDAIWTGQPDPKYFGGLTNTFSYKGFELSILFTFQVGAKSINTEKQQFAARSGNTLDRNQYLSVYEDRWTTPGQSTWVPRPMYGSAYFGSPTSFYGYNTRGLESTDFVRLKSLTISYNLPEKATKFLQISNLQVFAQGTNLWTKTNYTGYDPEFSGTDFGVYPQGKSITGGLKVTF